MGLRAAGRRCAAADAAAAACTDAAVLCSAAGTALSCFFPLSLIYVSLCSFLVSLSLLFVH